MRGSRLSTRLRLLAVLAGLAVACGGATPAPKTAAPKTAAAKKKGEWKPIYPASRVFPDVSSTDLSLVQAPKEIDGPDRSTRPGDQDRILNRMRITVGEGGVIKRADDLLPAGTVSAVELPARLGGGFVVTVINGRGTQVFRADTWLAKLKPLVEVSAVADREGPVVVGFDRLYLRMKTNNEIVAIDPANGQPMPLGPLPIAPAYGDMVFVDGWRAVIETELRGVMATFDAGATWRTVAITERVRAIGEDDGDPTITVDGGTYRIDDRGSLGFSPTKSDAKPSVDALASSLKDATKARPSPLGRKPLRAALEDGYPEEGRTAVVIKGGALGRVKLDDGSVVDVKEHATSETASCHGIKLGPEFGFVCGEPNGKTLLYEFHAPLDVKLVAEFDDPRIVTESGQGLVVISGPCGPKNTPPSPASTGKKEKAEPRSFCVRALDGTTRDIRVRGNLGSERIVALADGRVVVLVPPRRGSMGQISIIDKSSAKHVTIRVPDDAPGRELETGMWLDGFQESAENEIAGWVEAGGPVVGVRIKLDGTLTSGQLVEEDSGVLVSGPFGLALGTRGRALETVDGGMSWKDIVLPVAPPGGDGTRADDRTRRCGPVGCALPGTLRVGWADPSVPDDLTEAPDPPALKVSLTKLAFAPFAIDCNATLPGEKPKPSNTKGKPISYGQVPGGWAAFRGVEPPALGPDEVGIDNGEAFSAITPTRAYAWGKKDSDWARTGRLLVRFADRFALDEVRSSAVSQSLWSDETQASEVFGVGAYGYQVTWGAASEAGGAAAIVSACRPPNSGQPQRCLLMAVDQDRPVLPLRPGRGVSSLVRPIQGSTVRIGESWFFLADASGADRIGLYRADLGTVRQIREFPRPHQPRYVQLATPHLIRRAKGSGLGLTFVEKTETSDKKGERYVLPLDPDTGELGDPIDLGKNDLASLAPVGCRTAGVDGSRDGWLIQFPASDPAADVRVFDSRYDVDQVEVRLRLDQGFACVDAVAGNSDRDPPTPEKGATPKPSNDATFPLVVNQLAQSRRAGFMCTARSSMFGL